MRSPRRSDAGAAWSGFKRLTQLGWPRSFPIVQFPNAPLIIAFLAGQVAARLHGQGHADASAVSYVAMAIWAYEELFHGVNWFRNLLGLAYVISTVVHLATALTVPARAPNRAQILTAPAHPPTRAQISRSRRQAPRLDVTGRGGARDAGDGVPSRDLSTVTAVVTTCAPGEPVHGHGCRGATHVAIV